MPIALPLVALDVLLVVLWAIALALAAALIMDKLSAILAGVPWVGGKLSDAVKSMAASLQNAAGTLENGVDSIVGAAWHALARLLDKALNDFVSHSAVILHLARVVGDHIYSVSGLRSTVRALSYVAHAALKLADKLEKQYHGIEHRVRVIEHDIAAGIGNDIRTEVAGLEKTVGNLKTKVIPRIEAEAKAAEADVTALGKYVADHYVSNATTDIEAAVAVGLAALGLGGLRCNSNPWKNNPNACGLWGDLADLLGLALALGLALDFETFVHDCQAATEATVGAVESFVGLA